MLLAVDDVQLGIGIEVVHVLHTDVVGGARDQQPTAVLRMISTGSKSMLIPGRRPGNKNGRTTLQLLPWNGSSHRRGQRALAGQLNGSHGITTRRRPGETLRKAHLLPMHGSRGSSPAHLLPMHGTLLRIRRPGRQQTSST